MQRTNTNLSGRLIGLGAFGFFGILFLMGLHSLWLSLFIISRDVTASQHWVETPCEVLESRAHEHSDLEHGKWHTLEMTFEYEFDRQVYTSDRYDFSHGGSNDPVLDVVTKLPAGMQTVCYVNPDYPSEAVMKREGEKTGTVFGAVAVVLFGSVGMILTLVIGMEKNPVELIGDSVFLIVAKVLDAKDPPADPKQAGGKDR